MDYLLVFILLCGPFISEFHMVGTADTVSFVSGAAVGIISLITATEGVLIRMLPMHIHLWIDIGLGAFLIASPFVLGFSDALYSFHMLVGFFLIGLGLFTATHTKRHRPPVKID